MAAVDSDRQQRGDAGHWYRALRHRNYRLFFIGQGISLVGTWMQMVSVGWLITRLTGSAAMLGWVGFANRVPAVITPLAGVWIDRLDKHRLVTWAQALSMVQALLMAALALSGVIQVWHVIVLSAGLGLVNAIEVPCRQSFFVELLDDRDDLSNAIALNSSLFNSARLIGPALAGVLIAAVGEGVCFLLNGLSYLAVIAGLLAMQVAPPDPDRAHRSVLAELREGVGFCLASQPVRMLLLLITLVSLVSAPATQLLPIVADKVLHIGSRGFGFMVTGAGFGALCGALYLAQRRTVLGLDRVIPLATTTFAVGSLLLSLCDRPWLAILIMPVVGSGMMVQMGSANTVLQTIVPDDKRGRVMSLYVLAFMGSAPLGSIGAGYLAEHIGMPRTLQLSALLAVLGALHFVARLPAFRRDVRPIYEAKGILRAPVADPTAE